MKIVVINVNIYSEEVFGYKKILVEIWGFKFFFCSLKYFKIIIVLFK